MSKRFMIAVGLALFASASTPALAQNNKPVIAGTYYEDRAVGSVGDDMLKLTFAQTPSNKFLNVTSVSCLSNMSNTQTLASTYISVGTTSGGSETGRVYILEFTPSFATYATSRYYTFSPRVVFKIGAGRFPSIYVFTNVTGGSPSTFANCTITGELTDN